MALLAWLRDVATPRLGERGATALGVAFVGLVAIVDLDLRQGWRDIEADHARMAAESAAVAPLLAPGDRVAAWRGFHHGVFLERPVYSLHRAVRRLGAADGIESVVTRYDLDAVFLTTGGLEPVRAHLDRHYGSGRTHPPATLWRTGGVGVE